jgi:hypothetical protein
MKVFISWSGDRSKAVAQALQEWLPRVIQASEPWISSEITKGTRWSPEISKRLEESKVGVICLTRENLTAPWILFEAGAISKTKDAYVCTFLLDVGAADVEQPLGQFQHTQVNQEDVKRLVRTINSAVGAAGEKELAEGDLEEVFLAFWPKLQTRLAEISAAGKSERSAVRTDRELLEEMLEVVRALDRRSSTGFSTFLTTTGFADPSSGLLTDDSVFPLTNAAFTRMSEQQAGEFSEALKRRKAAKAPSTNAVKKSKEGD